MDKQEEELSRNQESLENVQQRLDAQKMELDETKDRLVDLSRLVGVKEEIIEALRNELADSDLRVIVDAQTGAISFDSSILFSYASYQLSPSGRTFLKDFLPMYISTLLGGKFTDYISEIMIEGHTDTDGGYMYNLNLSQQRAFAVAEYCLDEYQGILSEEEVIKLRPILTANGRSFSDPIYYDDGRVNMDASRRVVFKFRLKDDEMIEEMQKILEVLP